MRIVAAFGRIGQLTHAPQYDKQSKKAKSLYEKKDYESGSANHFWSSYRLIAPPADWLAKHPFFERAVNSLPATIGSAADHKKYTDVISRFGTHYVYECNFGARVSTDSFVESAEVKQHSSSWKKTSMEASISYAVFELGITDAKEKSDIKTDEAYDAASETIVYYEGGDPTLQNDNDQKQWVQSCVSLGVLSFVCLCGVLLLTPFSLLSLSTASLTSRRAST